MAVGFGSLGAPTTLIRRFYSTEAPGNPPTTDSAIPYPTLTPKVEDLDEARLELSILNTPINSVPSSEAAVPNVSYVNKQIAPAPEWVTDPDFPTS